MEGLNSLSQLDCDDITLAYRADGSGLRHFAEPYVFFTVLGKESSMGYWFTFFVS